MKEDITQTSTTSMDTSVSNYSVNLKSTDGVTGNGETYWDNTDFSKWYGYYRSISEIRTPINSLATWVLGQGYTCENSRDQFLLENITGAGEDTFSSIMWSCLVTMKFNGDSYSEVIRNDKGTLINIKNLDPSVMRTVSNPQGKIIRYEQKSKYKDGKTKVFQPNQIFHRMNDRVVDETHGISVCEAVQWIVDAKREAMKDWRRISHRSTIRILYLDEADRTKFTQMKTDYADAVTKGELLILPVKKGDGEFTDLTLPPAEQFLAWLRYLDNIFYQQIGIPRVIVGGTAENTEASAKVAVMTYEPTFTKEITDLEQDIWNQLGIKITINRQPSIMDNIQSDQAKNTGQTKLEAQGTQ